MNKENTKLTKIQKKLTSKYLVSCWLVFFVYKLQKKLTNKKKLTSKYLVSLKIVPAMYFTVNGCCYLDMHLTRSKASEALKLLKATVEYLPRFAFKNARYCCPVEII